jgi:hypothetical protein
MIDLLTRQFAWQSKTFGDDPERWRGIVDHIRKELKEIEDGHGQDPLEWIDLIFLATDALRRMGCTPRSVADMWDFKLSTNQKREWPKLEDQQTDKACEHRRGDG